jgi:hypothetical protein
VRTPQKRCRGLVGNSIGNFAGGLALGVLLMLHLV